MQIESKYRSPFWLKNCHVQTIVGSWIGRNAGVTTWRERLELEDGDFLEIDWLNHDTEADQPTLIVLHGLEGSIDSSYIQSILKHYLQTSWRIGVMHFRGCSGVPNRLLRSYHSGDTSDLHYVLSRLVHEGPLFVTGFSLGGNVLLKYLGEQGDNCPIDAAIAVSVPFNLDDAARRLDQGLSKAYRWYLLSELKNKTRQKKQQFPEHDWISEDELSQIKSFVDFDHLVTAPIHGFTSGADYYERCSCGQFLKQITKPTLIIHAKDDPFMTEDAIPTDDDLSEKVTLELSNSGGHVGFIRNNLTRYLDERIPQWLDSQLGLDD